MDAKQYIEKHSFFPLHKTHLKTEKNIATFNEGKVAYQVHDDTFVIAGDPICARKTDIPKLLDSFHDWAAMQGKASCGYYFSEYVSERVDKYSVYQAGITIGNHLAEFSIDGKDGKEFRRALNYGEKKRLTFKELDRKDYFENFYAIKNLESKWFNNKNQYKRIGFLLSPVKIEDNKISDRHFIVTDQNNKIIAYVSLDKYREAKGQINFYIDHMLKHPTKYKMALDFLIVNILLRLKEEERTYIDLGLCPFKNVKIKNVVSAGLFMARQFNYFYNSNGVYNYKKKFCNHTKPAYMLLSNSSAKYKQLLSLFNVTFVN